MMKNNGYIEQFERRLRNLDDPDETGLDEQLVLLTRESIADQEWSLQDQARINQLDEILLSKWKQFEDILPFVSFQDRSRWWWFLNEGPQVKAEAEQAQRLPA